MSSAGAEIFDENMILFVLCLVIQVLHRHMIRVVHWLLAILFHIVPLVLVCRMCIQCVFVCGVLCVVCVVWCV